MAKNTLIGSLKISLLATTKGYTKGIGKASRSTKRFTRLMRTNLSTALGLAAGKLTAFGIKGLGAIPRLVAGAVRAIAKLIKILAIGLVAAAGAAGVALALLTKNSLKDLDRLAKSSRIIGLTVNELKSLELAASEAGVENKVLEKSLRNMTRQVNDAAKGTGEAVDALNDLGINAEKLARQSIPEQFMAIADALAEVKDNGERIQLAFDLFGGRGLSLLNLSASAIRNASDELERMGLLISDIDAKKIEQFNDSVGDLKRAFKGVGDQIAIRLAPILGGVVLKMIALIEGLGGIDTIVGEAFAAVKPKVLAFANSFAQAGIFIATRLSAGFTAAAGSMSGLGDKALFVKNVIQNGFGTAADIIKLAFLSVKFAVLGILVFITKGVDKMIDGVIASINILARDIEKVAEFFSVQLDLEIVRNKDNTITAVADSFVADANKASKEIRNVWNDLLTRSLRVPAEARTATDDFIKFTGEKIASLTKAGAESFERLTEAVNKALIKAPADDRLLALLQRLRMASDSLGGAVRQVNEDFEDLEEGAEDSLDDTSKETGRLEQAVSQAADGIVSSLKAGEGAFKALRDVALSVIDDIISAFLKSQITNLFIGLFTGGGGGFFSGLFSESAAGVAAPSRAAGDKHTRAASKDTESILDALDRLSSDNAASPILSRLLSNGQGLFSNPSLVPILEGGGITINFTGAVSGDDAIEQAVIKGIRRASPEQTEIAVAEVQRRIGRDPLFLDRGI